MGQKTGFIPITTSGYVKVHDAEKMKMVGARKIDTLREPLMINVAPRAYFLANGGDGMLEIFKEHRGSIDETSSFITRHSGNVLPKAQIAMDSLQSAKKLKGEQYDKFIGEYFMAMPERKWSPVSVKYVDKELEFEWKPSANPKEVYNFHITDPSGKAILWERLLTNKIKIPTDKFNFDRCYYWKVNYENEGYTTEPTCIYRMNLWEGSVIQIEADLLKDSMNVDSSAFHNLIIAQYYEQSGFGHHASYHYKQAVLLSFNNLEYRKLFFNFLNRMGNYPAQN